ncbi:hypothetical protein A9404_09675 [Halothiobacillus diazotrophicus]|uniref:Lipid A biosynthesis acyltransferase n=1 Tax=Halothiobacillus diazotrophicus TaxID=1860122 RepID=A0A191ZI92_9GAMM|nr:hypothetical protein [Halothiobacillus diazotrophicus]ANJ67616.1 hypothetical protein A9404_09675 [Halothiobacillus diazotrophicus]
MTDPALSSPSTKPKVTRLTLKDRAELLLAYLFRFLPIDWVSRIGAWLGARAGRRAIAAQRLWVGRMHVSLERLLGITDPRAREGLIIEHTRNIGRVYAEIPILHRMVRAGRLEIVGAEHLENLSRPVIIATAHVGNWEFMGRVPELIGGLWCDIYLPLGQGVRAKLAHKSRAGWRFADGQEADYVAAGPAAMRHVSKAMARGRSLVLFIDEEKDEYVWAPSLGRDIPYAGNRWIAARLAVQHGLDILPVHIEPHGLGRYRAVIEPKLTPPAAGDTESRSRWLADRLDAHLDAWVRRWLTYWYWLPLLDMDKSAPNARPSSGRRNGQVDP